MSSPSATQSKPDLSEIREQLDELDSQILAILKQRALLVKQVGPIKRNQTQSPIFIRHEREADMIRNLIEINDSLLTNDDIRNIYREIISACRALESANRVAFLGPAGTFSEIATTHYFGRSKQIIKTPKKTIEEVFDEVERKRCHYGVVPIENSFEGTVNQTLDALSQCQHTQITAEICIQVEHNLLSLCDSLDAVDILFTHEQTHAQCRQWIDAQNKHWTIHLTSSNAEAARLASETPNSAAIASKLAAEKFELNLLYANIQTSQRNLTRFFVIGRHSVAAATQNQTSIIFSVSHQPGSLSRVLQEFAQYNVNLNKLQSRPSKLDNWQYIFYAEADNYIQDANLQKSLKAVEKHTQMLKVLGSYPKNVDTL